VLSQAQYFILDSSFVHYWQYDKSVNFIDQAFRELHNQDWFGLRNLGD